MSLSAQVPGKCTVLVDSGQGLRTLGISRGGVRLTDRVFTLDIDGDAHGGAQGPPVDVQFLGRVVTVAMRLSTWDATELRRVQSRLVAAAADPGTIADDDYGRLYVGGAQSMRLVLVCETDPSTFNRNFPTAWPTAAVELDLGTQSAEAALTFQCHADPSGVLWNANVSSEQ